MMTVTGWGAGNVQYIGGVTSTTYDFQIGTPVSPTPEPEDELSWLRRRVSEITELVSH